MKVNVTFECTPEEARALCGLPDLQPLQTMVMTELQDRVKGGFSALDPAELLKTMLSQYAGGLEQMQSFMSRVERTLASRRKE